MIINSVLQYLNEEQERTNMLETIRLKNVVKLFLLSLAVWLLARTLSNIFADNAIGQVESYDDVGLTPVAHLEDRLLELETSRRTLSAELNTMDSGSATFESASAELDLLDDEIATINREMNQIWATYDSDSGSGDFRRERGDYEYDDESDDDLDGLDYVPYEPFSPYF
jgi:hypothetical protein